MLYISWLEILEVHLVLSWELNSLAFSFVSFTQMPPIFVLNIWRFSRYFELIFIQK